MKYFKCIECGKDGHIKCTREKDSEKIKVDAKVMNDLNEFIISNFRDSDDSDSESKISGAERRKSINPE